MPPGRPRFDLDPYKDEIIQAFNRRETVESMTKALGAKGIHVNSKTFQRRLREWGLYRYQKTPKRNSVAPRPSLASNAVAHTPSTAATSATVPAPSAVAPSPLASSIVLQPITNEIPDSVRFLFPDGDINGKRIQLQEEFSSPSPSISIASSSPDTQRNSLEFNSFTLRAQSNPQPPQPTFTPPTAMSQKVWTRRHPAGYGLEKSLEAVRNADAAPVPIPKPTADVEELKKDGDSFTLSAFTAEDAFELGHLLHARLLPHARAGKPTVVSIALANSQQILFQTAVGSGSLPDNETWVQRKRASVLRWGASTWLLHNKFAGDEARFAALFGMGAEQAGKYAIHGGGVPIRVKGVEGVVAVVVVSGLKQDEDHGVIVDVIKSNWE
ncbi:DUF967 domain-containing protein [Colletotrichum musicola]|uniref:DUF967 domain-containing protein n=1 Tax=Colletotrichum musicola TaxID=2175873 RepID=A0A8H6NI74_9PEZI|nr:DUF967 domain-containing protein [Colletotrichum musicola]